MPECLEGICGLGMTIEPLLEPSPPAERPERDSIGAGDILFPRPSIDCLGVGRADEEREEGLNEPDWNEVKLLLFGEREGMFGIGEEDGEGAPEMGRGEGREGVGVSTGKEDLRFGLEGDVIVRRWKFRGLGIKVSRSYVKVCASLLVQSRIFLSRRNCLMY